MPGSSSLPINVSIREWETPKYVPFSGFTQSLNKKKLFEELFIFKHSTVTYPLDEDTKSIFHQLVKLHNFESQVPGKFLTKMYTLIYVRYSRREFRYNCLQTVIWGSFVLKFLLSHMVSSHFKVSDTFILEVASFFNRHLPKEPFGKEFLTPAKSTGM